MLINPSSQQSVYVQSAQPAQATGIIWIEALSNNSFLNWTWNSSLGAWVGLEKRTFFFTQNNSINGYQGQYFPANTNYNYLFTDMQFGCSQKSGTFDSTNKWEFQFSYGTPGTFIFDAFIDSTSKIGISNVVSIASPSIMSTSVSNYFLLGFNKVAAPSNIVPFCSIDFNLVRK